MLASEFFLFNTDLSDSVISKEHHFKSKISNPAKQQKLSTIQLL